MASMADRQRERLSVDAIDGRGTVERVTAVLDAAGVHIRKLHVDAADGRVSVQVDVDDHGDIGERVLTSVDAEWVVRRETL
jgi:acetolactate synthase regulatory subunit